MKSQGKIAGSKFPKARRGSRKTGLCQKNPPPESEQQHLELLDELNAIIFELDPTTQRCRFVTRRIEGMLGYPAECWLDIPNFWADHIHPEDREQTIEIRRRAYVEKRDFEHEYRMIRADGSVIWLNSSARIVKDDDGHPVLIRGFAVDISDRKRIEEAHGRLSAIIETTTDFVGTIDPDGRLLYINRAGRHMLGIGDDEDISELMIHDFHPTHLGREQKPEYVQAAGRDGVWSGETTFISRDGKRMPVSLVCVLHSSLDGKTRYFSAIAREMRQQKQAEEALREEHNFISAILHTVGALVVVLDREGRIVQFNRACEVATGYTSEEMKGTLLWERLLVPEEALAVQHVFTFLLSEALEKKHVNNWVARDGTRRMISWSNTVIQDDAGCVKYVIGTGIDITEHRRAEEALRETTESLRAIVQSSPLAIISSDLQRRIRIWNPAAERMFGWESSEVIGRPHPHIPPEMKEEYETIRRRVLNGERILNREVIRQKRDGMRFPVSSSMAPLNDASGRVIGIMALQVDVSDRKKAEEALKESEALHRTIVEHSNDMIWTVDAEGRFMFVNRRAEEIGGYKIQDLLGKPFAFIINQEDVGRLSGLLKKVMNGEPQQFEVEIRKHDGGTRSLSVNSAPIYSQGKTIGAVCFGRDITKHKQLEDQLRQSQKMEAVGRLAGGIAHDFNNLLTVITGYGEFLLTRMDIHDPLRRHVEEIEKAGNKAASLTRQLLAFSRRQVLQPKTLDLNSTVIDMNKLLQRLIGEDIRLRTLLDPHLGLVKADPGQLEQVILNLAVNARDAMPEGGALTIETTNVLLNAEFAHEHSDIPPGPYVMIGVSDTGCGMNTDIQSHLFEPFFTTKEQGKGTGLGLSTVFGIVKQSLGTISFKSQVGIGTTFRIYLPRVDEKAESGVNLDDRSDLSRGSETILIAEDEDSVRTLIEEILQTHGYNVLSAANGSEATLMSERHKGPIHLLVTDIIMPQMSGPELARHMTIQRPGMKVLFLSGYANESILEQNSIVSGGSFLQKPFSPETLTLKIREIIES